MPNFSLSNLKKGALKVQWNNYRNDFLEIWQKDEVTLFYEKKVYIKT